MTRLLSMLCALVMIVSTGFLQAEWKAGAAKVKITPQQPMWMSGYASRKSPSEGTLTDLWAKVLVLEDGHGNQAAVVTLDLVGIDRDLGLSIRRRIEKEHRIPQAAIALMTSHTHTGPVVGTNLRSMYVLDERQQQLIVDYTHVLEEKVLKAVAQAIADLEPARLAHGNGRATFAVNRRNNREADVPMLRSEGKLVGPVDHDVPVLTVRAQDRLKAVLFGYACHATVLSFMEWSGDYPGFAQIELEKKHPQAIAMFWAGCGADQNPLPRRKVEHAREYGRRLAEAVDRVLEEKMTPIDDSFSAQYAEIPLAFHELPSEETLIQWTQSRNIYEVGRGKKLLAELKAQGKLSPTYPYPVQTWKLGKDLYWIILGGEVVVDFSLRLKQDLDADSVWVAGYANDVMAYIPSLRVLREGGYEGERAMLYYGLPSKWSEAVEEDIVREVARQVNLLRK